MGILKSAVSAISRTLIVLLISSCASPKPSPAALSEGFAVTPAGSDMYRVNYRGDPSVPNTRILDFALATASNVAAERSFRYFAVIDEPKSRPGEIHYVEEAFPLGKVNPKELLIQCFPNRPKRVFCFRADYTARAIADKYGLNRTSPPPS